MAHTEKRALVFPRRRADRLWLPRLDWLLLRMRKQLAMVLRLMI